MYQFVDPSEVVAQSVPKIVSATSRFTCAIVKKVTGTVNGHPFC